MRLVRGTKHESDFTSVADVSLWHSVNAAWETQIVPRSNRRARGGPDHLVDDAVLVPLSALSEADLVSAMRSIAGCLGQPLTTPGSDGPQRLAPRDAVDAKRNSLSGRFGRGPFPLHTDLAHWVTPARFMILGAVEAEPGAARTVLVVPPASTSGKWSTVRDGVFLVSNGSRSFYSSILSAGRPFVRFDTACMKPSDAQAHEAECIFRECLNEAESVEIAWQSGDILVIDNWKVLHGRAKPECEAATRVLLRLYATERR
jgi:hypothetical protein